MATLVAFVLIVAGAAYARDFAKYDAAMSVRPPLDAWFEHTLPPVFRVVLMTALCLIGLGLDWQVLQYWRMNVFDVHSYPNYLPHTRAAPSVSVKESGALALYALAACSVGWALFCWFMYRIHLDAAGMRTLWAQAWEHATLVGLAILWLVPSSFRPLVRAWNRTLVRLFVPRWPPQAPQFVDVIAADVLTSFAKVLGDVWLEGVFLLCFLTHRRIDDQVVWHAQTHMAVPILISLPYLVRLWQCVSEYFASESRPQRPLYNSFKYASSLPVIWIRAWPMFWPLSRHAMYVLDLVWYACVLFNTLFLFWWDVTNDWGLDLLQLSSFRAMLTHPRAHLPELHRREEGKDAHVLLGDIRPRHARQASVLRAPEKPLPLRTGVYWTILFLNLILRFTWSLKLSSHWQYFVDWPRGVLVLEALEIVRRCVWVLLRVEWECVRHAPMDM